MIKQMIVVFSGAALLIAVVVAIVIASRSLRQPVPLPDVPVAASPAEVRVKAVGRMGETLDFSNVEAVKFLSREPRRLSTDFGILSPETP